MIDLIWLIPLLPLLGVVINTFFGRFLSGKASAWLATLLVGIAAALTLVTIFQVRGLGEEFGGETVTLYRWMTAGDFSVTLSFLVDQLSLLMTMVITGVGFLIHMYSIGYMAHDPGIRRYFIYLNLFVFAMLMLVLGDNYLLMFLGWEGVGLCSYLLISFWFSDTVNADAGKKAFIVNRIGDFAVLLGIFLTWTTFGSLAYADIFGSIEAVSAGVLGLITFLFFVGCTGKSAQIPLYVWLPDAMAGPTPVSALIHAATMVTAGVYLLVRSAPMLDEAILISNFLTRDLVAWIGVLTALFAATIALTQTDIKRVLAYSTVSQLGYMFLGVGTGAYIAAIFHLFTHAFFKALLFLGSGSVMHGMEHGHHAISHGQPAEADDHATDEHGHADSFDVQDMRNMGGLWQKMPATAWTFLIGGLALAGFPLTSGFFSKDEILTLTQHGGYNLLYVIGIVTAFMTAFYTFRQFFMVFWGKPRTEAAAHAHESPSVMTVPLMILAAFALLAGLIFGLPLEDGVFHHWLEPLLYGLGHHEGEGYHLPIMASLAISSIVAIAGIALAYLRYGRRPAETVGEATAKGGLLHALSYNKWYVDEIYHALIVRPYELLAAFSARFFDRFVIDGAVNGVAKLLSVGGGGLGRLQSGFVRSYALGIVSGLFIIGFVMFLTIPNELRNYFSQLGTPAILTFVVGLGLLALILWTTLRPRKTVEAAADPITHTS
ncbi:MAG: NADH-quinone oxidoreductase subunit L [Anaerolineales bacterium]|nr:NADH-quinone oxidoreductase subunit L [Anaerolineales bacterium]MCB9128742.1 NADH-quinone oxidoreductase subunit L [Ardenticatenales bacterium]